MDRREAVLRELNLYPLWVRREPVSGGMTEVIAANEPPPATNDTLILPVAGTNELPWHESSLAAVENSGGSSLREFQAKIAAGPLAGLDWPELKQKVSDCQLCGLRAGCTQTVFGSGDERADWLFVGEAPGREEDAQGLPFVGESGRLLDNMLVAIGLRRNANVYIANVVKCRPPEDRTPHLGEIAACLPYLKRQIGLLKPRLIVVMGKTAVTALLDSDATLATLRGKVYDYAGIPLIVTYHPAYLLRKPTEKARVWEDLRLAVETINALAG